YVKALFDHFAWWRHDDIAIAADDGVDEIALAMAVDAVPRTMRGTSRIRTPRDSIVTRHSLTFLVAKSAGAQRPDGKVLRLPSRSSRSAAALDSIVVQLEAWYGRNAGDLITIGMEYPRPAGRAATDNNLSLRG